jgi:gas vesicle protein
VAFDLDATLDGPGLQADPAMAKLAGQTLPLKVTGTIAAPSVLPDFGKLVGARISSEVSEAVDEQKDEVEERLEQQTDEARDRLRDRLRRLRDDN